MNMSNRTYDILKWLVMIAMPTLGTLYATLSPVWGWPLTEEVTTTISAVTAALGVLLGISTVKYNKAVK